MVTKEKLYEAFGELIYAVAKADGLVQGEEVEALQQVLKSHSWAADIIWSFNYERGKDHPVEQTYRKAIDIFGEYGPAEEYAQFTSILEAVAAASQGITEEERKLIGQFHEDLTHKFKADLERISNPGV